MTLSKRAAAFFALHRKVEGQEWPSFFLVIGQLLRPEGTSSLILLNNCGNWLLLQAGSDQEMDHEFFLADSFVGVAAFINLGKEERPITLVDPIVLIII